MRTLNNFAFSLIFLIALNSNLALGQLERFNCKFDHENTCDLKKDKDESLKIVKHFRRTIHGILSAPPTGRPGGDGNFLLLNSRSGSLSTGPIKPKKQFCLEFYYHLYGINDARIKLLRTLTSKPKVSDIIFYRDHRHENVDKWHHFQETVPAPGGETMYTFLFERESDFINVAIDDISAVAGPCTPNRKYCDFDFAEGDNLNCPWITTTSSDPSWKWWVDWAAEAGGRPTLDHSSRSPYGGYLTTKGFENATQDATLSLSPQFTQRTAESAICLSFWIFRLSRIETSVVQEEFGEQFQGSNVLFNSTDNMYTEWQRKLFTVVKPDSGMAKVTLSMRKVFGSNGPVQLDSLLLLPGQCPNPFACDFDQGFCGYKVSGPWMVGNGRVANPENFGSSDLFPPVSDTRFAYVDFSLEPKLKVAQLTSDLVDAKGQSCFKFTYYSLGPIRSFIIYHLEAGKDLGRIFDSSKDEFINAEWTTKSVDLTREKNLHVMIEVTSESDKAFFALDDVKMDKGPCKDPNEPGQPLAPLIEPGELSCNFEDGSTCAWSSGNGSNNVETWTVFTKGDFKVNPMLPRSDHSTQSLGGRYLYTNQGLGAISFPTLTSEFEGKELKAGQYCFSVWSVVRGLSKEKSLQIVVKTNDQKFYHGVQPTTKWAQTLVSFKKEENSSLEIKLLAVVDHASVAAIDDLELRPGNCHDITDDLTVYKCSFMDSCDITVDQGEDEAAIWTTQSIATHSTTSTHPGRAMVFTGGEQVPCKFRTKLLSPKATTCVSFYYKLNTYDKKSKLVVSFEKGQELGDDEQRTETILFEEGHRGDIWHHFRHQIDYHGSWKLMFEGSLDGLPLEKTLAIDDITVLKGECPPRDSCNFERDDCLWQNVPGLKTSTNNIMANAAWERFWTELPVDNYPKVTADGSAGTYIVTDEVGQNSLLMSPKFEFPDNSSDACLTFSLSMNGMSQRVDVYKAIDFEESAETIKSTIPTKPSGAANDAEWRRVSVDISSSGDKRPFWLYINGAQKAATNVIALDDLVLKYDKCDKVEPFKCDHGETSLDPEKVCDFRIDCKDGSDELNCGFFLPSPERQFNGWTSTSTGIHDWELNFNQKMLNVVELVSGQTATLQSPVIKRARQSCQLTLEYTMNPRQGEIAVEVAYNGQERVELWSSSAKGLSSAIMGQATISLGKIKSHFQMYIVARASDHGRFTPFVGNIKFGQNCYFSTADEAEKAANCSTNEFKCYSGECIDNRLACNGVDDCGDNSDESTRECPDFKQKSCDFKDFCFFKNTWPSNQAGGFVIQSEGCPKVAICPTRDHTQNSRYGPFALMKNSLSSPRIGTLTTDDVQSNCANFMVKARGDVRLTLNGNRVPLVKHREGSWMYHHVDGLKRTPALTIEATVNNADSYLALDDFSWGTHCNLVRDDEVTTSGTVQPVGEAMTSRTVQPVSEATTSRTVQPVSITTTSGTVQPVDEGAVEGEAVLQALSCDFNIDMCAWGGRGKWTSVTRSRPISAKNDGPLYTSNMSPDEESQRSIVLDVQENRQVTLLSKAFRITQKPICFSFDYYLFGALGSILLRKMSKVPNFDALWFRDENHDNYDKWHRVHLDMKPDPISNQLAFSVIAQENTNIAFDNFLATDGPCPAPRKRFCDFNHGTGDEFHCDWIKFDNGDSGARWSVTWPGMRNDVEPSTDESGSWYGHFLTSNTSGSKDDFPTLQLKLPDSNSESGPHCLGLFYWRDSEVDHIIELLKVTQMPGDKDKSDSVWTARRKTQTWAQERINIDWSEKNIHFVLNVRVKKNSRPIGLDSMSLTPGECPPAFDCTFDQDMCSYSVATTSSPVSWLIGTGRLANPDHIKEGFVPPAPPSEGSSMYAYVDMTQVPLGTMNLYRTELSSPSDPLDRNTIGCLRFKYFVEGPLYADGFTVFGRRGNDGKRYFFGHDTRLPSETDGQWKSVELTLDEPSFGYSLHLELMSTSGRLFFALADVSSTPNVACDGRTLDSTVLKSGILDPGGFSCDFDNRTFCSWRPISATHARWALSDHLEWPEDEGMFRPKFDHTKQTTEGTYAFATSVESQSKNVHLTSFKFLEPGKYCVSLWTALSGTGVVLEPSMLVLTDGAGELVRMNLPRSPDWTFVEADFVVRQRTKIEATLSAKATRNQSPSFDDIEFHHGSCDSLLGRSIVYQCTFEGNDDCGIAIDGEPSLRRWEKTHMDTDHTNGKHADGGGRAMALSSPELSISTFYTKSVHPREIVCVGFFYRMTLVGAQSNSFERLGFDVKLVTDDSVEGPSNEKVLFSDSGNHKDYWHTASVQIENSPSPWKLAFTGIAFGGANGFNLLAIDDISITRGICPSKTSCDFNDDSCPWTNVNYLSVGGKDPHTVYAHMEWSRHPSTIPSYGLNILDSNSKKGSFLLTEGSGGEAILMSPRIEWPSEDALEGCLSLNAYRAETSNSEIEVVKVVNFDDGARSVVRWPKASASSDKWTRLEATLTRSGEKSFFIFIVATRWVAVDQLRVDLDTNCKSKLSFKCPDGVVLDIRQVCDFKKDCSDGSDESNCGHICDFASTDQTCGWRVRGSDKANIWAVRRVLKYPVHVPRSPTKSPILTFLGSGHDASTDLVSQTFRKSPRTCTLDMNKFSFISLGRNEFAVDISINGQSRVEIWDGSPKMARFQRFSKWMTSRAFIGKINEDFTLYIRATAKAQIMNLIAIDDFNMATCYRENFANVSCELEQFTCDNLNCVSKDNLCDGQDDCGDTSDERGDAKSRSKCDFKLFGDFEDGNIFFDEHAAWTLSRGCTRLVDGPTRDHTSLNSKGHFLLASYFVSRENTAKLVRKNIPCDTATFYVMASNVKTLTLNSEPVEIDEQIESGYWQQIKVKGLTTLDNLTIEATLGKDGYVAIDDFYFSCKNGSDSEAFTSTEMARTTVRVEVTTTSDKDTKRPDDEETTMSDKVTKRPDDKVTTKDVPEPFGANETITPTASDVPTTLAPKKEQLEEKVELKDSPGTKRTLSAVGISAVFVLFVAVLGMYLYRSRPWRRFTGDDTQPLEDTEVPMDELPTRLRD